jgi:ribose 5-phosphate isomerase B
MKLVLGCDHGGLGIKNAISDYLKTRADSVTDLGTFSSDSVDYADFAVEAAEQIVEKKADRAILVCTTGVGMSIAANRFAGVRAALCESVDTATKTRTHNDANVVVLAGTLSAKVATEIVRVFLDTPFSNETRHQRRVCKLERAERLAEVSFLAEADPQVHAAIVGQISQENSTINLIASENTVTRAVREASGSVLTNNMRKAIRASAGTAAASRWTRSRRSRSSVPRRSSARSTRTCSRTAAARPTWRSTSRC